MQNHVIPATNCGLEGMHSVLHKSILPFTFHCILPSTIPHLCKRIILVALLGTSHAMFARWELLNDCARIRIDCLANLSLHRGLAFEATCEKKVREDSSE